MEEKGIDFEKLMQGLTRYPRDEKQMQQWLADTLTRERIEFEREVKCGKGYVDFVIGRTAIELKLDRSGMKAIKQLFTYLADDRFDDGILICARPLGIPIDTMQMTKPIRVLELWKNFL